MTQVLLRTFVKDPRKLQLEDVRSRRYSVTRTDNFDLAFHLDPWTLFPNGTLLRQLLNVATPHRGIRPSSNSALSSHEAYEEHS